MDFVTVRELRTDSARLWDKMEAGEDFVITCKGKPFAIMVPTLPTEVEANLRVLRATALGLDTMTMEEINAEIALARKEKRDRDAGSH